MWFLLYDTLSSVECAELNTTEFCLVEEEAEQSKDRVYKSKAKKGTDWSSHQSNGCFAKMTPTDLCLVEEEAEQSKDCV